MSRSHRRACGVSGAIALILAAAFVCPAAAQPHKKVTKKKRVPVTECTRFDQVDREEDEGVDLVIDNQCDIKLACSVHWSLTCKPASGKSTSFQRGAAFSLDSLTQQATTASAGDCGNAGWVIDDVSWSCNPQP